MKIQKYIFIILVICFLIGCKKDNETTEETTIPTKEITEVTTQSTTATTELITESTTISESREGYVKSKLTGEWVKEEIGTKRPYAIMFNNIKLASPQSGTSKASIMYEAIVEGGITRLMGIFEELDDKRIGSVRSARHYFVSFADEYNAIYVHFGETKYATKKISELKINNLSGLTGVGDTVFYRDKSIAAPHNAFTSWDRIIKGTDIKKYSAEYKEGYEGHFKFYDTDTSLSNGVDAKKVTAKFSNYTNPYFVYNEEDKLYYRFQFGKEHVDYNTKEQLKYKNVIVQFVKEWDIDKNDYQTMDLKDANGKGYYITNGKAVNITWKKNESTKIMRYYDTDGNELKINTGKTFIIIFPNDRVLDVILADKSE